MAEAEGSDVVINDPLAEGALPLAEWAPDTDDEMILPVLGVKRRRKSYIPLPVVLGIFPDVTPAILCDLADMNTVSPSRVLAIVPTATVSQLCDFCKLEEYLQAPDVAVDQPPKIPDLPPARDDSGPVSWKSSNRGLCRFCSVQIVNLPDEYSSIPRLHTYVGS